MRAKQFVITDHRPFILVGDVMGICDGHQLTGETYINTAGNEFLTVEGDNIQWLDVNSTVHSNSKNEITRPSSDEISSALSESDKLVALAVARDMLTVTEQDAEVLEMGPCHAIVFDDRILIDSPAGAKEFELNRTEIADALRTWGNHTINAYRMAKMMEDNPLSALLETLKDKLGNPEA